MPDDRLAFFADATFTRPGSGAVLTGLTWDLREGETWAVVGPLGAGKSTFAAGLAGRLRVSAGDAGWPGLGDPATAVRLVGFKEESHRFSYARHYYQQRYNFVEPQDDITLGEFLQADTTADDEAVAEAAGRLGVAGLLGHSFIQLSNGQVRRSRIAKALLARPGLLVLDEPFVGLDAAGRARVASLLGGLVARGERLLLVCGPADLPDWVTHVLTLEDGRIAWRGPRADFAPPSIPTVASPPVPPAEPGEPVVELRGVTVAYGGRAVLDGVDWTVRAGERWTLLGPNGSGKSTLLALLCGDHPQAYSNDVRLFGRRRGTGESIWEVKRDVGLVSPELHLYFTEPLTAFEAAVTGFHDVVTRRPASAVQAATVRELFDEFGVTSVADRSFARLSAGQQRLVLLARGLVKRPPLVVLDEPFQALDEAAAGRVRSWLERRLRPDQTLIFVTHRPEELPRTVTRRLRLEAGRVAERV
jgi:molybdate transport system ATP-binding protein